MDALEPETEAPPQADPRPIVRRTGHTNCPLRKRRQHLSDIATSAEEQQVFAGTALQARAAFESAPQQLAQAEINLRRTRVRSPVNGYVTNLVIGVGDFAH